MKKIKKDYNENKGEGLIKNSLITNSNNELNNRCNTKIIKNKSNEEIVEEIVSVLRCSSYEINNVYNCIKESLKLIDFEIKEKTNVLLKPNVLGAFSPDKGVTTHPNIIFAICKLLKEKGCKIMIGDSCGRSYEGTTLNAFRASGIEEIAKRFNTKLIPFERDSLIRVKIPEEIDGKNIKRLIKYLDVPKSVIDADLVINLPKLKTHMLIGYTGAIKNMFGIVVGKKKQELHSIYPNPEDFARMLVDIYDAVIPGLNIMDGIISMEGNGPSNGIIKKTGIIAASKNGIALDFAICSMIGFSDNYVLTNKVLKLQGRKPHIAIKGEKIKFSFRKPNTAYRESARIFLNKLPWLIEWGMPKISINKNKCTKCLNCLKSCPAKAIKINDKNDIIIDRRKCILCYCCHELCPIGAIDVKQPLIAKYILNKRKGG